MLYLLDANVLIDANRDYYPQDRVPEFWVWLLRQCRAGTVKIPPEIYKEVALQTRNPDKLVEWAKRHKSDVVLDEVARRDLVDEVVRKGYVPNPTSSDLAKMKHDPALISYALRAPDPRTIVTTERSKPAAQGANRKVPDVCDALGIRCIGTYKFIQKADFRTDRGR